MTSKQKKHALTIQVKNCELCEELVQSRKQSVMGYGDFNADVLIIGEAPGRLGANETGVPFTKDRSGIFLQKMLGKIGFSESDPESVKPRLKNVYITNIVKCNPQTDEGTNRPPKKDEILNCSDYLKNEIDIVKPRLIVTLGLPSSKIILGEKFSGMSFGKIIKTSKFSVLPMWHPAFVIRGGGAQKLTEVQYYKYFKKIQKFVAKK